MRKSVLGAAGASVLLMLGAGAAVAANSGSLNASTSGAYTSGGTYNFTSAGCQWSSSPAGYDGRVAGNLVVTSPNVHLNAKVDGYGWTKIKQANSATTYSYSSCIAARSVYVHSSISIQVCKEKVLADDCTSKTVNR